MSHNSTARGQDVIDAGGKYALIPQDEGDGQVGQVPVQEVRVAVTHSSEGASHENCRNCIGRWFVQSDLFQSFVAFVIICNCVIMGLETDFPAESSYWKELENVCLGIFTFEITMRIAFLGQNFLYSSDIGWNVFDASIVLAGLVDAALVSLAPVPAQDGMSTSHHKNKNKSFGSISVLLRAFRLLRILRVFRLFKVLTAVYTLVTGFMDSLVSVFWVSVLASLCLFVCAVFLTRTLGQPFGLEMLERSELDDIAHLTTSCLVEDCTDAVFYQQSFGTVPKSMLTLFTLMATPDLTRMQIATHNSAPVTFFFITFIVFGSFAMISILTGVISESMVAKGQVRRENMRFEEEDKLAAMRAKLRVHFKEFDTSGDGLLSRDEFIEAIPPLLLLLDDGKDEDTTYTEGDLLMVYDLMDLDGSGEIDTEEFLKGMEQFDCRLHQVPLQIMKFQATLMKRHNNLAADVKGIKEQLQEISSLLKRQP